MHTLRDVMPNGPSDVQERAGRNESRYRNLNERMEPSNAVHVWVDPPMPDWICECASTECMTPVPLTIAEYEAVRAESTHFLVVPDEEHLSLAVERVVLRNERYWVVEKLGEAAEVSQELDPRAERVVSAVRSKPAPHGSVFASPSQRRTAAHRSRGASRTHVSLEACRSVLRAKRSI